MRWLILKVKQSRRPFHHFHCRHPAQGTGQMRSTSWESALTKKKTINVQFGKKIISLVHQFMPATYIDRKNNQVLFGRYDLTVHPFWGRFFGVVCHEIVWGKCTLNIFCSPPTPPQPINKQLKCSSSYKRESTFINRQKYPSHKQRQNYWAASFNDGKPHSGHRNNFNPTKLINKNVIKWSNEIRIAFEVWLNWIIYF